MMITRTSPFSGKVNTRDIDVSEAAMDRYSYGMLIQDAMPLVSADDREFIMTGITPEEWSDTFGEEK